MRNRDLPSKLLLSCLAVLMSTALALPSAAAKAGTTDIPSPLRSVATGWGAVDQETRRRLAQPLGAYSPPVLKGGAYQKETADYVIEQKVEVDLDGDGQPETVVATQNGPERWRKQDLGPEGHVMIFDGKTHALRYKTKLGMEVVSLNVLQEGLPVAGCGPQKAAEPFVFAIGRNRSFSVEIVAYNREQRQYERLLRVGGGGGVEDGFLGWHCLQWGRPLDSLQVYGYLWDQSGFWMDADLGTGLVLVVYAWEPSKRKFSLILPSRG
jgi:hypothetical protein